MIHVVTRPHPLSYRSSGQKVVARVVSGPMRSLFWHLSVHALDTISIQSHDTGKINSNNMFFLLVFVSLKEMSLRETRATVPQMMYQLDNSFIKRKIKP